MRAGCFGAFLCHFELPRRERDRAGWASLSSQPFLLRVNHVRTVDTTKTCVPRASCPLPGAAWRVAGAAWRVRTRHPARAPPPRTYLRPGPAPPRPTRHTYRYPPAPPRRGRAPTAHHPAGLQEVSISRKFSRRSLGVRGGLAPGCGWCARPPAAGRLSNLFEWSGACFPPALHRSRVGDGSLDGRLIPAEHHVSAAAALLALQLGDEAGAAALLALTAKLDLDPAVAGLGALAQVERHACRGRRGPERRGWQR